jgi:RNA 3'-terminal phosphate cyclase
MSDHGHDVADPARDVRGATLDLDAADQLPVFLALADGVSVFRASQLSSHAATAMWLLERLTAAEVQPAPCGVLVHVHPEVRSSQGRQTISLLSPS